MKPGLGKSSSEWFKQADYDLSTAKYMFNGRRFFYAVFMSHLAAEKALKGIHAAWLEGLPPRTHNLLYLVEKLGIELPSDLCDFVFALNRASVPTRHPDDLSKLMSDYDENRTESIVNRTEELIEWLKTRLERLSNT